MKRLWNTAAVRSTKNTQTIVGYYNSTMAQKRLGVCPTTLMNRRNNAAAKRWWFEQGLTDHIDELSEQLRRCHKVVNGRHFFEISGFDQFVLAYVSRPQVIAARKARDSRGQPITMYVRQDGDEQKLAATLKRLRKIDGLEYEIKLVPLTPKH